MKCLIVDDDEMIVATLKHYVEQTESLELAESFTDSVEAINYLQANNNVDILLLDIEMPELSGLELLDVLDQQKPHVILVTSKPEYAVKAFEYDVLDYLLKPIQYPRFLKAINKCIDKGKNVITRVHPNDEFEVHIKSDLKHVRINLTNVFYIEAMADYVMFVMKNGNKHMVHATMKSLEVKLPDSIFTRVHRSFIVNMKQIDSAENNIVNTGGAAIPIGASYRSVFFGKLNPF